MIAGAWLLIAPWALGHEDAVARWNDVATGALVILFASLAFRRDGFRLVNTALAGWLILAPLALAYRGRAASIDDVLVGLLVLAVSLVPARKPPLRRRLIVIPGGVRPPLRHV